MGRRSHSGHRARREASSAVFRAVYLVLALCMACEEGYRPYFPASDAGTPNGGTTGGNGSGPDAGPTAGRDAIVPVVTIAAPGTGSTISGTLLVTGAASDNAGLSKVEVQIDGGPWALATGTISWSFSWNTTATTAGAHVLRARATDAAGNTSMVIVPVTVSNPVPDTTPPVIVITSHANGATVSGTVLVTGTASDNVALSKVELQIDGGPFWPANSNASWVFQWNTTVASPGGHVLRARATDAAGNTSVAAVTVTVNNPVPDTTAPSIAFTSHANGATVTGTVLVTGTASDNVALSKVELQIDGGPFAQANSTASWAFQWNTTTAAPGSHVLRARATDTSGNIASATVTVTVSNEVDDNTPPVITITAPTTGSTVTGTVVVSGTASDNVSLSRVEVQVDGGTFVRATGTTSWSLPWDTATVTPGSHTLTARATDTDGNTSHASVTVTVPDNTPPVVTISTPAAGATVSGTVQVSGTASDNASVSRVELQVDAGPFAAAAGTSSWGYSWNASALAPGPHTLRARATDPAGNTAHATVTVTVADTTPVVAFTSPASGSRLNGSVTVAGTASDDVGVTRVEIQLRSTEAFQPVTGTTSWSFIFDATGPSESRTLTVRATDAAGNTATDRLDLTVLRQYPHLFYRFDESNPCPGPYDPVCVHSVEDSGAGHQGLATGEAQRVPGHSGGGMRFLDTAPPQEDQQIFYPSSGSFPLALEPSDSVSVAAWIKPVGVCGYRQIMNRNEWGGGTNQLSLMFQQEGEAAELIWTVATRDLLGRTVKVGVGNCPEGDPVGTSSMLNVWTHVAGTFSYSAATDSFTQQLWVNGAVVSQAVVGQAPSDSLLILGTTSSLAIANRPGSDSYEGTLDDVLFSPVALTSFEVNELMLRP